MSTRVTLATARRVLRQLRGDSRTLVLILVVPLVLLVLLRYMYDDVPAAFDRIGATMVGVFPLIVMFVVTSIAMLRERTRGTLERLMSMPVGKSDILLGYGLAFGLVATAQAVVATLFTIEVLGADVAGPAPLLVVFAIANALLGVSLGLLASAFARTEFQAVQFMPALIFPQTLLCGLLVPRDQMATWLQWLAHIMPLTYAYDGLERVFRGDNLETGWVQADLAILIAITLGALLAGAATLRRRTD